MRMDTLFCFTMVKINAYALYLKGGDIEYQYENGEYVIDNREKFEYITRNFLTNSER